MGGGYQTGSDGWLGARRFNFAGQVGQTVINGEATALAVGEVVRLTGDLTVQRSQANLLLQGTIGVAAQPIGAGAQGAIVTNGKAIVLVEAGLVPAPVAGETLYVSLVAGRATNIAPANAYIIGIVKDASNYATDSTVVADIAAMASSGSGGGSATVVEEVEAGENLVQGNVVRVETGVSDTVVMAFADAVAHVQGTIGVTREDIDDGDRGDITTNGKVEVLLEAGHPAPVPGQYLWVSEVTAGTATTTQPVNPALQYFIGVVKDNTTYDAGDPRCIADIVPMPNFATISPSTRVDEGVVTDAAGPLIPIGSICRLIGNGVVATAAADDLANIQGTAGTVTDADIPGAGGPGTIVNAGRTLVLLAPGLTNPTPAAGQYIWVSPTVGGVRGLGTNVRPDNFAHFVGVLKDAAGYDVGAANGSLQTVDVSPMPFAVETPATTEHLTNSGAAIPAYSVVRATGTKQIEQADASSFATVTGVLGVTEDEIVAAATGRVICAGQARVRAQIVSNLAWAVGQPIWVSATTVGAVTNIQPTNSVYVGVVKDITGLGSGYVLADINPTEVYTVQSNAELVQADVALVQGDIVCMTATANRVTLANATTLPQYKGTIGVVLSTSIAIGARGWVVNTGRARMRMDGATAPVVGDFLFLSSAVSGRATTIPPVNGQYLGVVKEVEAGNLYVIADLVPVADRWQVLSEKVLADEAIARGEVVRMSGNNTVTRALADNDAHITGTIGVAREQMQNNGVRYWVATHGRVQVALEPLHPAVTAGQSLWVSATTAGRVTTTQPANHAMFVGVVKDATNWAGGSVVADITPGQVVTATNGTGFLYELLGNGLVAPATIGAHYVVRMSGNSTVVPALSNSLANIKGVVGVVPNGIAAAPATDVVITHGPAWVAFQGGLSPAPVAGDYVWVSRATAGYATNVPPEFPTYLGVVKDASLYNEVVEGSLVLCDLTVAPIYDQMVAYAVADGALSAMRMVYMSSATQVKHAKADVVATATNVVGALLNSPANTKPAIFVESGFAVLYFDEATPVPPNLVYLSVANAGQVQTTVPPLAGTNQKLRLGQVVRSLGAGTHLALVKLHMELIPITSDGLAP